MKRFAEEVSSVLGYGGEINDRVMEVGNEAMRVSREIGIERGEHKDSNPRFRVAVLAARDGLRARQLAEVAYPHAGDALREELKRDYPFLMASMASRVR
jgi:hypothetical protein